MRLSFSRRLSAVLALLLCGFGALVGVVGHRVLVAQDQETLQRLSHGLALHIVEHWPNVTQSTDSDHERRALNEVLNMLMVVNPAIEVYVLDARGRVRSYLGDPQSVRQAQVDLVPVRDFLAGASLPLFGSDPKGASPRAEKIFSAAMFSPQAGDLEPPGYLYVVLEGQARDQLAGQLGQQRLWQSLAWLLMLTAALTLLIGTGLFHRLTTPLRQLAERMSKFGPGAISNLSPAVNLGRDEVQALSMAFDTMALRIEQQLIEQEQVRHEHREVVANVAHDLRTPLTALHGHLEALKRLGQLDTEFGPEAVRHHLGIALDQSNKVRHLSQQLFELASLQSNVQAVHMEHFRLDELVTDTVQKFSFSASAPTVTLDSQAPGPIDLNGDLQLIERALSNLIENALRHAPSAHPISVNILRDASRVHILIEDRGPGLPTELARRLDSGQGVREPPMARPGGGFGGLGLAIAQRIATLHCGSLTTRPCTHGGTILCLSLPTAMPAALPP